MKVLTHRLASCCWLGLCLALLSSGCGRAPGERQPNILLVLADDLGFGDVPAYSSSSKVPMPNLDRLANAGMRFTDAHSPSAVCAPTRYSVVTGNYPWRGRHVGGVWKAHSRPQILDRQMTLADLLQEAGYRTAKFGKHHLGGNFANKRGRSVARRPEDIDYRQAFARGPLDHGFDASFIIPCGIQDPPYAFFRDDRLEGDVDAIRHWEAGSYGASQISRAGAGVEDWDSSQAGPRILSEALDFLRAHDARARAGDRAPFFLYYSAVEVHWPWTPAASLAGQPVRGVTEIGARGDLIYQFDLAVGALIDELERLGQLQNTLVIVTSDNGGDVLAGDLRQGHKAVGELRGRKGELTEGGHRVPFLARWGDGTAAGAKITPGSVSRQMIGLQDLAATLAAAAGLAFPEGQAVDSFNFLPTLLAADEDDSVRDHLIVQDRHGSRFALRQGEWKLVLETDGTPRHLFRVDPSGVERNARATLSEAELELRRQAMAERFAQLRASARTAPLAATVRGQTR